MASSTTDTAHDSILIKHYDLDVLGAQVGDVHIPPEIGDHEEVKISKQHTAPVPISADTNIPLTRSKIASENADTVEPVMEKSEETVAAVERDILPDKQGKEITKDFTTNLRDALAGVEKGVVLSNPYYDEILPDVKTDMFEKGITEIKIDIMRKNGLGSSYRQEHEEILTSKLTKYLDILADEDTQVALDNKALEITKDVTTANQDTAVATTTLKNITHKIKCKMGDKKCYQRGKIGKHSLAHITMEKSEETVAAVKINIMRTLINIIHKIKCKMGDRKCYQRGESGNTVLITSPR